MFVCLQSAHWASFRIMACFSLCRCVTAKIMCWMFPFLTQISRLRRPPPAEHVVFAARSKSLWKWQIYCVTALIPQTLILCRRKDFPQRWLDWSHLRRAEIRLWSKRISKSILCVGSYKQMVKKKPQASLRHHSIIGIAIYSSITAGQRCSENTVHLAVKKL